jgi:GTPase KRas protein
MIGDSMAVVEVLGAVAEEGFLAMQEQNLRDGHGFMLLYSITSRSSFLAIRGIQQHISLRYHYQFAPTEFPTILVGVDCERETERDVSAAEGHALASELNCQFLEVSHETEQNVEKAYFDLVGEIRVYDQCEVARILAQQKLDV